MGQNDVPWPSRHPRKFSVRKLDVAGRGAQPLRRQSVTLDRFRTTTDSALQVIPNFPLFESARGQLRICHRSATGAQRLPYQYGHR